MKKRDARQRQTPPVPPNRWPALVVVVVVVVAAVFAGKALLAPKPIKATDPAEVQLDQALAQKRVTFALFHSKTCIPCKQMEQIARTVMPEFEGRVTYVDVDVYDEANLNLLRRLAVRVIPTTFIYDRSGQNKTFQGVIQPGVLRAELNAALSR